MRPARSEATEYWFSYIDQAPEGEILEVLRTQGDAAARQLSGISNQRSTYRYAPDKWSIRQLLAHINDCERIFQARAFWFARGFDSDMPSFDDHIAAAGAESDRLEWQHHLEEFRALRASSLSFFAGLPPLAWDRTGVASGSRFTVRSLAWVTAGHAAHHLKILAARY